MQLRMKFKPLQSVYPYTATVLLHVSLKILFWHATIKHRITHVEFPDDDSIAETSIVLTISCATLVPVYIQHGIRL